MLKEYGIVANVLEPDKVFRHEAKVWLIGGTGGEGWDRFIWLGLSRGGRRIQKWGPTKRFCNFRCAWIPDHVRESADGTFNMQGTRLQMSSIAASLEDFAASARRLSRSRRKTQ